ncbi:MAG: hypothetical protein ACO3D0_13960, partial [Ilumatobacteraceae bacterium]
AIVSRRIQQHYKREDIPPERRPKVRRGGKYGNSGPRPQANSGPVEAHARPRQPPDTAGNRDGALFDVDIRQFAIGAVTLAATLASAPRIERGVLIGIAMSLVVTRFDRRSARPVTGDASG